jgi:hypothetical protein
MVYILVDPYKLRGIFNRVADRIIHELVFSTSFSLFLILLIVWMGLYTGIKKQRNSVNYERTNKCYLITKDVVIIFLFFIYPLQIAFSYHRGSRNLNVSTLNIVIYVMSGVIVVFILLFIYYTLRIKYLISKSYSTGLKGQSRMAKVNDKSDHPDQENGLKKFIESLKENTSINYVYNLILHPNDYKRDQTEDSDEEDYYYEEEIADIDIKKFKDSDDSTPLNKYSNGLNLSNNLSRSKPDANGGQIGDGKLLKEKQIQLIKSDVELLESGRKSKINKDQTNIKRDSIIKEEMTKSNENHVGKRVINKMETRHKDISILNKVAFSYYRYLVLVILLLSQEL